MGYRVQFDFGQGAIAALRQAGASIDSLVAPIMQDAVNILHHEAVQNLSGVTFQSKTGTHTINKRSGRGAASVQPQYPYGSPFKARIFADYQTRYANNPESYNILKILEEGHGGIKPKYTPAMNRGMVSQARLTVPGGRFQLVSGQTGFRGMTGRYSFVREIPPMQGRYWMDAAAKTAEPKIKAMVAQRIKEQLG
jgi:hypothetical protein